MPIDFAAIRSALATLPSDHDAAGAYSPKKEEIFYPDQHANALDLNTTVVVGARGTGKSFWAGVLGQDETRGATASAYPNLGLNRLIVKPGYTGLSDTDVNPNTIDKWILRDQEAGQAPAFWRAVIIRAGQWALESDKKPQPIGEVLKKYSDPDDADSALRSLDKQFADCDRTLLVTFDALDTVSREWVRSSRLVDALFEVIWALRVRRSIRAKIFIRPEQLDDETLKFVELPKLRSGRVELEWGQTDLYGLLYWRIFGSQNATDNFRTLVGDAGISIPADALKKQRRWTLLSDRNAQKLVMDRIAGLYMGRTKKRGGTYDWPYNHLGDAQGKVTPRSFIKLFVEAAKFGQTPAQQVVTAEGIRYGLQEASKVRVEQLVVEYQWVKRALAPLAGVMVPCERNAIFERWRSSDTISVILHAASDAQTGFLPPFRTTSTGKEFERLAEAMQRIGMLSVRDDNRIDIPDLFRVAARMLKKGGTPPRQER